MNKIVFIKEQRISSRKIIAALEQRISTLSVSDRLQVIKKIAKERQFLESNFEKYSYKEILSTVHILRHAGDFARCPECQTQYKKEEVFTPRIGNLLDMLKRDIDNENRNLESKKIPSQNDLTRWALKNAVFKFYSDKNLPVDTAIVDNQSDDRLAPALAPDFDVIAQMWLDQLDALSRKDDKYRVEIEEMNKAQNDLAGGMRGSAFEKQLDRFRKELMQKIKDEFYAGSN